MRWSTRLPARSTWPRYLHTASGSSNGSTTSVTHSMPSSRRHRMASPAKKTNLASYTDQLARPFEHEDALLFAQRDLARIDRKLTHHGGSSGPPAPPRINAALDNEAAL